MINLNLFSDEIPCESKGYNLITNGDFSQGNQYFTNDYEYVGNGSIKVGGYAVTSAPKNHHPGFAPCSDVSASNDNMMIIFDGSNKPDNIIWEQDVDILPNKYYKFSYIACKVVYYIGPLIQVFINDKPVGEPYDIYKDPSCTWMYFEVIFKTDSASKINIKLKNKRTEGGGNDFALDEIQLFECNSCDDIRINAGNDIIICKDSIVEIGDLNNPDNLIYDWSDNSVEQKDAKFTKIFAKGNKKLILRAYDSNNCEYFDTLNIYIKQANPEIIADQALCSGDSIKLYLYEHYSKYLWANGDTTESIYVSKPGIYTVKCLNESGCEGYDEIEVKEQSNLTILNLVDFGEICPGDNLNILKSIKNDNPYTIKFKKYFFCSSSDSSFKVELNRIPVRNIEPYEVLSLSFSLNQKRTNQNYEFIDTLLLEFDDCTNYAIPLKVVFKPSVVTVFSIDTVTAYMNEFCLPIFGVFNCNGAAKTNIDYEMTLKIHSHNFKPEFVKFGNIKNIELIDGWYYVTVIHNNCEISSDTTAINYICGTVLHADSSVSIVEITDFKTANDIDVILGDGSVGGNTCMRDFRYLMNFRPSKLIVSSGFEHSTIICKTQETGNFRFELADVSGNIILSRQFTKNEKNYEDLKIFIDNNDIANGVYFVVVRTPWNILREKLIISK